jgi:hypothetical protein
MDRAKCPASSGPNIKGKYTVGRGLLLLFLGVPIPVIILLALLYR